MSAPAPVIDRVLAAAAPVLCVDTCTLLDVVRDITRHSARAADAAAGLRLLDAAEDGARELARDYQVGRALLKAYDQTL